MTCPWNGKNPKAAVKRQADYTLNPRRRETALTVVRG
jgi:hypothetical protein